MAETDDVTPEARAEALRRLTALSACVTAAGSGVWIAEPALRAALSHGSILQVDGAIAVARRVRPRGRDASQAFAVHFDGCLDRIRAVAHGWVFGETEMSVERELETHVRALLEPASTHREIIRLESALAQMLPRDDSPDPGDPAIAENPAKRRARP